MPQKIVEVPGLGSVEFPDTMDDGAIATAIQKQLHPATTAGTGKTGIRLKSPTGQRDPSMLDWFPHMAEHLENPSRGTLAGVTSDTARFMGMAASPAAVGPALAHPAVAGMGLTAGGLAQQGVESLGSMLGFPNAAPLAGDVAGLATGLGISKLGSSGIVRALSDSPTLRRGVLKKIPGLKWMGDVLGEINDYRNPPEAARPVVAPPRLPSHGTSQFNPENQPIQPITAPPSSRMSTSQFNPQSGTVTPPPPLKYATGISNQSPDVQPITPPPPLRHATGISNEPTPEVRPITPPPKLTHATGISNQKGEVTSEAAKPTGLVDVQGRPVSSTGIGQTQLPGEDSMFHVEGSATHDVGQAQSSKYGKNIPNYLVDKGYTVPKLEELRGNQTELNKIAAVAHPKSRSQTNPFNMVQFDNVMQVFQRMLKGLE